MRALGHVPVHVLSGFLGSGKTTLLNRLLAALPAGTRPAVVVNDFGAVAVDGALVDRGSYAVAELASGCVCCTLSAPMQDALSELLDEEQPDTILMETTGLAEPAAFPALFAAPGLADRVHLGNVVCVVDASTYLRYADHLLVLPRQVEQANTVVMNKIDLTDAATREAVRGRDVGEQLIDRVDADGVQHGGDLRLGVGGVAHGRLGQGSRAAYAAASSSAACSSANRLGRTLISQPPS